MVHVEWTLSTVNGPVIGSVDVVDVSAAFTAVRASLRASLPSWRPEHTAALSTLQRACEAALTVDGRWEHRSTAVAIVLTRTDGPR